MIHTFCKYTAQFLLRCLYPIDITGAENIPSRGPVILASNHMSNLDPILLGAIFPRRLSFMAKEELFRNKLCAALLKDLGAFPLRRSGADLQSMKEALRRLQRGGALLIFPQGTRTTDASASIHAGVGFLAARSNAQVIPARIFGTDAILPKGASFVRGGRIKLVYGKPLRCENAVDYSAFSRRIVEDIFYLC